MKTHRHHQRAAAARLALGRVSAEPQRRRMSATPPLQEGAWRLSFHSSWRQLLPRIILHCLVSLLVLCVAGGELLSDASRWAGARAALPGAAVATDEGGFFVAALAPLNLPAPPQVFPLAGDTLAPDLAVQTAAPTMIQAVHELSADETLGSIAARYAISLDTLIWANGLERGDALRTGQLLRIPRVSGLLYELRADDTLSGIAERFGVPQEQLTALSGSRLGADTTLSSARTIFIPGATQELPAELLAAYGGTAGLAERKAEAAGGVREKQTNLRAGPGTSYARVSQLEPGRHVRLLARHKEWFKVALGASEGWVRADLLTLGDADVEGVPETTDIPPLPPRWVWPARGTVTSGFGRRWGAFHNGLDIANRAWTPIVAASSGVVREAGWCRGYGYCVKIRHSGGIETVYGHMVAQPVVTAGDDVAAGELIGHMGSTYDRAGGGYSTGVHLHLTIYVNGTAVNPLRFLP